MKKILFYALTLLPLALHAASNKTAITTTNPFYGKIEKFATVLGTFEADQETTLKAQSEGTITKIHFKDGDRVKAGDVLVSMDEKVAKARFKQAKTAHDVALKNLDRAKKLVKSATISKQAFEETLMVEKEASSALTVAETALKNTEITAPFEGTVGFKVQRPHTFVDAGTALVTLVDFTPLMIEFHVPENYTSLIHIGDDVNVKPFFKRKDTLLAKVHSIDARLDENHQLKVRAKLSQKPAHNIYPGQSARVKVALERREKALLAPLLSLKIKEKASYAYKIDNGTAKIQKVKLGLRQNQWVEVIEGLDEKDVIAYEGSFKLEDGEDVLVKEHKTLQQN